LPSSAGNVGSNPTYVVVVRSLVKWISSLSSKQKSWVQLLQDRPKFYTPVTQWIRVLAYEAGSRRFESFLGCQRLLWCGHSVTVALHVVTLSVRVRTPVVTPKKFYRIFSSVGRVAARHAVGRRFESYKIHHIKTHSKTLHSRGTG